MDNHLTEPVVWADATLPSLLYRDPDGRFEVSTSVVEGAVFVHTDVFVPSVSTIREIDRVYDGLRAMLPSIVFAASGPDETPVFRHFLRRYGWEFTGIVMPCNDGADRRLYKHVRG